MKIKAQASYSEIIFVVGIILVSAIIIFQLRTIFASQAELTKESSIISFATDLESFIDKSLSTTGDTSFVYQPIIKKYTLKVSNNVISIFDKATKKSISFPISSKAEITDTTIEDQDTITIERTGNSISFK